MNIASTDPRIRKLTVLTAFFLVSISTLIVAFQYVEVIKNGGSDWGTGDWLIHYRSGIVRRGLTGSIALAISDWTGANPIGVVGAMQIGVWLLLSVLVIEIFARTPKSGPILMLLISPMFLQFPFFDSANAMMKETIAFLGIAMLAAYSVVASRALLLAGCLIVGLSAFANEASAFMAPSALAFILAYRHRGTISKTLAVAAVVVMLGLALAGVLVAVLYPGKGMSGPICQELGSYIDPQRFCGSFGAVWWLEQDLTDAFWYMWRINVASGAWPKFIVGYLLALLPFLLFRPSGSSFRTPKLIYVPVVLGIVIYAPLFLVATDWGRWINMHVFSLTMITVTLVRQGYVRPRIPSANPVFLLYGMVWAMPGWGATSFSFGLLEKIYRYAGLG